MQWAVSICLSGHRALTTIRRICHHWSQWHQSRHSSTPAPPANHLVDESQSRPGGEQQKSASKIVERRKFVIKLKYRGSDWAIVLVLMREQVAVRFVSNCCSETSPCNKMSSTQSTCSSFPGYNWPGTTTQLTQVTPADNTTPRTGPATRAQTVKIAFQEDPQMMSLLEEQCSKRARPK